MPTAAQTAAPLFPIVLQDESPAAYAERAGQWYANKTSAEQKKQAGQYLTPQAAARFMASLCSVSDYGAGVTIRVLDPGAGAGVLACALCEHLAARVRPPVQIELDAYETDVQLIGYLQLCLRHLENWLRRRGIVLKFRTCEHDFLLSRGQATQNATGLFANPVPDRGQPARADLAPYDVAICNPPYFKIGRDDARAQADLAVVHGQPNIYALFMAVCARSLRPGGELIFITPRSFASGPYFRRFRERFFADVTPTALHVFDSRRDAFGRDAVLQENLILRARKHDPSTPAPSSPFVAISSSAGLADLVTCLPRPVPLKDVLDRNSVDKILHVPIDNAEERLADLVRAWTGSLAAYGLAISTGPVVPFRAVPLLASEGSVPDTHAPLLWMQHVKAMSAVWPLVKTNKPQYLVRNDAALPLLVPNKNYVLLRRFSSKEQERRLIAAPYMQSAMEGAFIGLENHLNYIYRPGGELSAQETIGLAALLNSRLLDTYFRIFNGSTQVSATELRAMPFPLLEQITAIGRRVVNKNAFDLEQADSIVEEILNTDGLTRREQTN